MFQSANRAMAGNAEASELSLLDTLLKTYEIQDNFKTLTPFMLNVSDSVLLILLSRTK